MKGKLILITTISFLSIQTVYPQACESTGHVVDAFVDASNGGTITADFSWDKMSIGEEYQINYLGME